MTRQYPVAPVLPAQEPDMRWRSLQMILAPAAISDNSHMKDPEQELLH